MIGQDRTMFGIYVLISSPRSSAAYIMTPPTLDLRKKSVPARDSASMSACSYSLL